MKVGNIVFVPNAFDMIWEPCITRIEEIADGKYWCEVPFRNLSCFNSGIEYRLRDFKESEIFSNKDDCALYIKNYYYGGLCDGCKYKDDAGTILNCSICKHNMKVAEPDPTDWHWGYCEFTGIPVWSGKGVTNGFEICQNFYPALPQYKDWNYERYEDLLKNCEFNKECIHHKDSCHKTCTFEHYMDEFVSVPVKAKYNGRDVAYALIKRSDWIKQNYITKWGIICWGVKLKPILTKTGRPMKGTINQSIIFDKEVELNLNKEESLGKEVLH